MKYLFVIGHPAQFHFLKNIIFELKKRNQVEVLITSKDILEDLCIKNKFDFHNVILPSRTKSSKYSLFVYFIKRYISIFKIISRFKPDLILGSEITLPLLGRTFNIPSIIFSEDDAKIIPQFAKVAYPFATVILSPESCNAGKWERKKIGYSGFQKLAYLHPNQFNPASGNIRSISGKKYFVLRFAELKAYHDKNRRGITDDIAKNLISLLEHKGNVYISSERELDPNFEKYRLKTDITEIHNVLYYADMYIGDSQSMAVESALLGTPCIRFNDFAGEIGVLEELEHKYGLTYGMKTNQPGKLYEKVEELLKTEDIKNEFQSRRKKMLADKIDVTAFMVWFIENYPESKRIMRKNPDYQFNFK